MGSREGEQRYLGLPRTITGSRGGTQRKRVERIKRRWSNRRKDYFGYSALTIGSSSDRVSASSRSRYRTQLRWALACRNGRHSLALRFPDCLRRMWSPRPISAVIMCVESSCWEHAILRDSQRNELTTDRPLRGSDFCSDMGEMSEEVLDVPW